MTDDGKTVTLTAVEWAELQKTVERAFRDDVAQIVWPWSGPRDVFLDQGKNDGTESVRAA